MKKTNVNEVDDLLFWGITWVVLLVVCVLIGVAVGLEEFGFFVWGGICFSWGMFMPDKAIDKQKAVILHLFGR